MANERTTTVLPAPLLPTVPILALLLPADILVSAAPDRVAASILALAVSLTKSSAADLIAALLLPTEDLLDRLATPTPPPPAAPLKLSICNDEDDCSRLQPPPLSPLLLLCLFLFPY